MDRHAFRRCWSSEERQLLCPRTGPKGSPHWAGQHRNKERESRCRCCVRLIWLFDSDPILVVWLSVFNKKTVVFRITVQSWRWQKNVEVAFAFVNFTHVPNSPAHIFLFKISDKCRPSALLPTRCWKSTLRNNPYLASTLAYDSNYKFRLYCCCHSSFRCVSARRREWSKWKRDRYALLECATDNSMLDNV